MNNATLHNPPPLLTPGEAAELLDLPAKALQIMIQRGELPAYKVGGQWRLRASELGKFIRDPKKLSCR